MPLNASQLALLIHAQAASLRLWVWSRCSWPDDVVQEAFCRLASQDPPPENPVAWLYAVARNLADKQRRGDQRRRRREEIRAAAESVADASSDALELADITAAVENLPDELREVLVPRIWGGLSLDEIARICGISAATAWRRYQTALTTLRNKLDPCERQK
jgi:RNA polymerase sigma-70 factor (ECF subfamily)